MISTNRILEYSLLTFYFSYGIFGYQCYKNSYWKLSTLKLYSSSDCGKTPLFSFGLIADIQYADSPDSLNFQQTKMRRYLQSIDIYRNSVNYWNKLEHSVSFALILGDILDAKASATNTQYHCVMDILKIMKSTSYNQYLCFGNHDHNCFSRDELRRLFLDDILSEHDEDINNSNNNSSCLYYDWSPHPKWRFISLDSYDVSLIGYSSLDNKLQAEELLRQNNPNDLSVSGTWFNNLAFDKYRWVPYNGGLGNKQLTWLQNVLDCSKNNSENVVIFCHQPIYSIDKPSASIWNAEEIRNIIWKSGNVRLWIAGHDHDGQYNIDQHGTHHIIPPAPIERENKDQAYGHIEVFSNKLVLNWVGTKPTKTIIPWPKELRFE
eukprot:gene7653-10415_t